MLDSICDLKVDVRDVFHKRSVLPTALMSIGVAPVISRLYPSQDIAGNSALDIFDCLRLEWEPE